VQAVVTTESPAIARRVYRLIKALYGARAQLEQHERHRLNRNFSYRVTLTDDAVARRMLTDAGMLGGEGGIPATLVRKSCCEGALLRGLFLGCGSMSDPGKGYHLELVVGDEALAQGICALLTGSDIRARVLTRRGKAIVYIKEAEHVSEFLVLSGAHVSMLRFENVRVEKNVRNKVNRVVNCDTANLEKTVQASARQIESIRVIERTQGLSSLPQGLRDAAEARLENPDATLEIIAELLGGVSKSGLNHRFLRLEKMANDITAKSRQSLNEG
jgi:DNA-binding protein WhiA